MPGPILGFDFETEVVDLKREVPRPVVLSLYDGKTSWLVDPALLPDVIVEASGASWVGFHAAFDWHVARVALDAMPLNPASPQAIRIWMDLPEAHLYDGMILEQLIRLASGFEGRFMARGLGELAQQYLGLDLAEDKKEVRLRFGEFLGKPLQDMPEDMKEYAAGDAYAHWHLYHKLTDVATQYQPIDFRPEFGYLSERIQLKGSIALEEVTRQGFRINKPMALEKREAFYRESTDALQRLIDIDPEIVKRYGPKAKPPNKPGEIMTNVGGVPRLNLGRVRRLLSQAARERGVGLPLTVKSSVEQIGFPTLNALADGALASHPIVKAWGDFQDKVKLCQFLQGFVDVQRERVHANYNYMVRSGRTSAWGPNIQQTPREGWFRSLYIADEGEELVTADYSAIELVTLGAILEKRYGHSELAEVIRSGKDAHCWTASKFLGLPYEHVFAEVKAKNPEMKKARQSTKAVNFGVPGGLGAPKLKVYALNSYGVHLTLEQCRDFRSRLITEVYPELTPWLEDNLVTRLSASTGAPESEVIKVFGPGARNTWRPDSSVEAMFIAGATKRSNGEEFSPIFADTVWLGLEHLTEWSNDAWLREQVREQIPSPELHRRLFWQSAVTLTGRSRGGVDYGQWRNTQFQGLAADGAKLALWRLLKEGFTRIRAFVHDEVVVGVPAGRGQELGPRIATIMSEEMAKVLDTDLPVGVEWQVGNTWSK